MTPATEMSPAEHIEAAKSYLERADEMAAGNGPTDRPKDWQPIPNLLDLARTHALVAQAELATH